MAKGSVRKKGKKWYGRFYIEDESGRKVQKEFAGTESKAETEAMLRKAIADYEEKQFVGKAENITVGDMLDMWVEEELKPGNLSNGTVMSYQGTVNRIKQYPIGKRKLKTVTADHLQAFIDFLSYGGTNPDGTTSKPMSKGYMLLFSAVLQNSFRFAVFPKKLITFNPMQYVKLRGRKQETDIFSDSEEDTSSIPTITHEQFQKLEEFLKAKDNPALLPVQIAYYTGLRIGEVCGLTWQDINLEEQYLTVRRSMRYNGTRHTTEVGTTKRSDSSNLPSGKPVYETFLGYSTSACNFLEIYLIIELLKKMADAHRNAWLESGGKDTKSVGVISFYQMQVNELRRMWKNARQQFDFSPLSVEINTVDRFQGKEKNIIIASLVRNNKSGKASKHVISFERINVAFSRAQELLVIVGARHMYEGLQVELPNMDRPGHKTVPVYQNIIATLHRKACYKGSEKLITPELEQAILEKYEKERRDRR